MDTAHQWPQGIVVKPVEEILTNNSCPKPAPSAAEGGGGNKNNLERKANRPQKEQALNCPRCNSTNTKFCYYNNYSLTQPRYFCKTCRRYWTEGGSLRSIPVGGGSRKNKRSSSTQSATNNNISSAPKRHVQQLPDLIQGQDLNLTSTYPTDFHNHHHMLHHLHMNNDHQNPNKSSPSSTTTTTTTSHLSAMELLTGLTSRGGFNSFMPIPIQDPNNNNTVYSATTTPPSGTGNMIPMHDFKPTLNFSLDGLGNGYGPLQGVQESNGRLLFPFEDLKQVGGHGGGISIDQPSKDDHGGDSTGYWTGMLGGGGSW